MSNGGSDRPHWRMELNNYLQSSYGTAALRWEVHEVNPTIPIWEAIAYIQGVEYARGRGVTQGAAKEEAAQKVLRALHDYRRGG